MKHKVLFVERNFAETPSIDKAFRQIAASLSIRFETEFQRMPYGGRLFDTIRNLLFFRKKGADLYHITGSIHYIALLFHPRNTVLSIMDVRFLYKPPGLRRYILKKLYLDLPVKRLKYITAISEHTRNEILRYTGCAEEKVRTLELPLFDHIYSGEPRAFNDSCPTILQVGTLPNKNISNLARALKGISCKLRIIGPIDSDLTAILNENHIDFENAVDLNDRQMRKEYQQADIVAFCSTFEGFGLPIIEAQSMRKPLITSNLSPMKETSGGAAYLADPTDVQSIREGIQKLIGDADLRQRLVEEGVINIERFRPELIVKQYERLYDEILSNSDIGSAM